MLNPEQQKAVQTVNGRVLILAGAGSGKTTVLAHRIEHLLTYHQISPLAILGLTFTNKAAEEMRQRIAKMRDFKTAKQLTLCTFHSFCMQVLRKDIHHLGYTSQFSLYDEREVKRLMKSLARHLLEHEGDLPSLETTIEKISLAKNKGVAIEDNGWHDRFSQDLLNKLEISMRAYNALDFDTLLSLTVQLFEEFPQVLKRYQERFRFLMIDEYQDTNPIQFRLASLLSQEHQNLCVVGDDDQSIYGWRGAEIKYILEFKAHVTIKLEQNYRSTPTILQAANAIISHNRERYAKQLWSAHETGDLIELFYAPREIDEAQAIMERMTWLYKHKKIPWNEMAILYRSNILARPIEQALLQTSWQQGDGWVRGIPYQVFGGTELFERSEIKDLIAYLKIIANPFDEESLLRIINVPRRGISEKTLDFLTQKNRKENIPLFDLLKNLAPTNELTSRALNSITQFISIIETARVKFKQDSLKDAFSWLLEKIDYKRAIQEEVKSEKMRAFKWENVTYCLDALTQYEEEDPSQEASLQDFLSTTLLDKEKFTHRPTKNRQDRVNLMTFHSAKGLEFQACFLIGLEDHILPHEKSLSEGSLEEERRLFYVAFTRAKKHLTLSMSTSRKRMGKEMKSNPSRFLFDIPKHILNMTAWNRFTSYERSIPITD